MEMLGLDPEPEPEPHSGGDDEPNNDPEAMNGTTASADAIKQALADNPNLAKEIDDIKASVDDGSYKTKYG